MTSEQIMSKAITRGVTEATRIAIKTMAESQAERTNDASGPKIGSPAMKQLTFNWNVQDKYSKLKTFKLDINNVLSMHNTPEIDKLAVILQLVKEERPAVFRNIDNCGERNMQHPKRPIHNISK